MKLSPRARRWSLVAAICLLLFTVIGFFVAPPIIKAQAEKRLSAELGRTVTLGRVRVNPYALSLTLENFDIREADGRASFLGWTRLYVNFDALSSLTGDWVLSDIELEGFHAAVAIHPDHSLNVSDLLAKFAAPGSPAAKPPAKPARPIRVVSLKVVQARVDFSDQSRKSPFHTTVGPLTFALAEFRTAGARGAPYHFEAVTEAGEKLAWSGTLAADPVSSRGEFEVANLILKKYTPYLEDQIQADLTDGLLSMHGHYEADLDAAHRTLKLSDGEFHLRDFKLNERSTHQSAVELASLDVTGVQADAVAMKATVDHVALAGGRIAARREQDGTINLLAMLQPAAPAPATSTPPAAVTLPDVTVGNVTLKDFALVVTDNAAPRPVSLALSGLQLTLKNATLADGAVMPLDLSFAWAPQGTIHVAGSVRLKPQLTVDLKADVVDVAILPLSPYVEQFVNARITQGAITTASTIHAVLPAGGLPAVTLAGDVSVQQFGLVDAAHNGDLAGFAALKLTGLKAATAPQLTVTLAELAVAGPYARVVVNADKSINLLGVMKAPAPDASATKTSPTAAAPLPKIEVGRVVLSEGDFRFTDRSVEPNVRMAINQFGGTIAGLSSQNLARADVALKGTVDGAGPVAITGKLDPLGASMFVDLKVDFKNVDLLPISPYTGKYAGYELARGKLVVDTTVHVDGKKLDTANVVTLNQFTFGPPTNSPDATGLPVRLGVALLKDIDGKIVIDLPVQGSLDDPNFRIGKVVMRVIVNLLTKAATSPFSLLGSMFGGGGEELAFQEFTPGGSELLPADLPKLETMTKALTNRPGLSLGIEGAYDAAADAYALKQQKLAEHVRRQVWEARHAADPNIPPPAQLMITPEENAAMVKKLFDEKFPPGTQFGAPLAAAPVVTAAPAPPKPGLVKRVINAITFQGAHANTAAKPAAKTPAAVPGVSLEEMTGRLAETMKVDDNDLRALAAARAQRVRDHFINTGHIAADRLFLAQAQDAAKQNKGPRVFLSLQ